jgi:predicted membrane protein
MNTKLFRFVKNVGISIYKSKYFTKKELLLTAASAGIVGGIWASCIGLIYGLGFLGRLVGFRNDLDLFTIGSMVLGILIIFAMLVTLLFVSYVRLKEIWNKS